MARLRSMIPDFLGSRQTLLCLPVLLAVILMPPETGLGVDLCMLKNLTGAPCPGCGVTRSCSNLVRGNLRRSVEYHPFGLVFAPVLLGIAFLSVLPGAARKATAQRISRCGRLLAIASILFWSAFFVFGLVRWVAVMTGYLTFPPPRS
jgi:Protein of unknown function (DUF2752)